MQNMQEKIRKDLMENIDSAALMETIASGFYERILELKKLYPVFYSMLWEYDDFTAYFEAAAEDLNQDQRVLLSDMKMAIEDEIDDAFDAAEDHVMEELQDSRWETQIREDFDKQGITLYPGAPPSADQIEELYVESYRAFDRFKEKFVNKVMSLSPKKAYAQGEKLAEDYRNERGIIFDEDDFLKLFDARLDQKRLSQLLSEKVEQVMRYSRHYKLEIPESSEEETDEELRDAYDGVMSYDGDMRDQGFTFVSELMNEYTGRRVLAAENEWTDESYWTTYGEDFQDLILMYVEQELESLIRYMESERLSQYEAFARLCGLDEKRRKDAQEVLLACDKVNYGLAQRVEELWTAFCEQTLEQALSASK